ncbi:MAG: nucleoside monophosphate kinase, partial [Candidatus Micrarchaeota archaeon]|nr:nucleoside monophosphate kinase [Candidatus Micrarchaeota archaeon]
MKQLIIILFGAPGVGKGTLAQRLQEAGVAMQISTGDLFRKEISENTAIGQAARKYLDSGQWVPDDVTKSLVESEILKTENMILDGYPRTVKQISDLDEMLVNQGRKISLIVNVTASEEVVIDRIVNRIVCLQCHAIYNKKYSPPQIEGKCDKCGGEVVHRSDDSEEIVKKRFEEHNKKTKPLLDIYKQRGLVVDVN